jgi:DNA (cytosine-5)-methyltransferase 1
MGGSGVRGKREVGVRLVRGPFVRLAPHPGFCRSDGNLSAAAIRARRAQKLIAADLFCGAGGLSLGIAEAGFEVLLGVDSDPNAVETHAHHFPGRTVQWDLADPKVISRVVRLLKQMKVDLIAGGPPCQPFSRAGKSWIKELVKRGQRHAHDDRRELWRSFVEIVERVRPRAVLMENVPEMALDRDMRILRGVVFALENAGYTVEARLLDAWRYGVPQFRQRLIVVALRDHLVFRWPQGARDRVKLRDAISDLPRVQGGWRPDGGADGFVPYDGPRTNFQKLMRRGLASDSLDRLYDHITRPVRPDDAEAFALMDAQTRYPELPTHLKRYREDVHDDRYKRLDMDDLSRTITAHIAKDGYWYIHPEQDRTLTIREAARIQTFPDRIRFAGPPSFAFRQIGNAVPPNLAEHLAKGIREAVQNPMHGVAGRTGETKERLARWMIERSRRGQVGVPWYGVSVSALAAGRRPSKALRWRVLASTILLDRVPVDSLLRDRIWPLLLELLRTPEKTIENASLVRRLAHGMHREMRVAAVLDLAAELIRRPEALGSIEGLSGLPGVSQALATLVVRIVPDEVEDPITTTVGVLRVAARFGGTEVDKRMQRSWGRIELARLVGIDRPAKRGARKPLVAALAHIALLELAERVCTVTDPVCEQCPIAERCSGRAAFERPHLGQQRIAYS